MVDYGALGRIIGELLKYKIIKILIVISMVYFGSVEVFKWFKDKSEYASYNYSPFWDDRVVVGVDEILTITGKGYFDTKKKDLKDTDYLVFPTADEIFKEELFLNQIKTKIPGMLNRISINDDEAVQVSPQEEVFRTIDNKIVFFKRNISKAFLLSESEYKSLAESFRPVVNNDDNYDAILKQQSVTKRVELPLNYKELPLFAYFENDFDMTESWNRYLLTPAATLESEKKEELINEYKKDFYNYAKWKKSDDEDFKRMIRNMPYHLLTPEQQVLKTQLLNEQK